MTNSTPERQAVSAAGLYVKTDIPPEQVFLAIGRLRKEARDEIDRLIRFLDESDGHMEREPDLGFPENHTDQSQTDIDDGECGETDDREENGDELDASYPEGGATLLSRTNEDDEDGADEEPSLGFQNSLVQETNAICGGRRNDWEDEHDGLEPENEGGEGEHENDEPSLAWPERIDQTAHPGADSDREQAEGARPPQNRTQWPSVSPNMLRGGQLEFPGGQATFDAMMKGRLS